jgi:hypothetical protein
MMRSSAACPSIASPRALATKPSSQRSVRIDSTRNSASVHSASVVVRSACSASVTRVTLPEASAWVSSVSPAKAAGESPEFGSSPSTRVRSGARSIFSPSSADRTDCSRWLSMCARKQVTKFRARSADGSLVNAPWPSCSMTLWRFMVRDPGRGTGMARPFSTRSARHRSRPAVDQGAGTALQGSFQAIKGPRVGLSLAQSPARRRSIRIGSG